MNTHNKETAIAEALDRVPLHQLEEAIMRRVGRSHFLTVKQLHEYKTALKNAAESSDVPAALVIGASRLREVVDARWRVYATLHRLGWTVAEISHATGHDRSRISNGLRSLGLIDPPKGTTGPDKKK